MDFSLLLSALVNRTVTYFLDLFLNGIFNFLSDLLFGVPSDTGTNSHRDFKRTQGVVRFYSRKRIPTLTIWQRASAFFKLLRLCYCA